jgi:hypothetical protein
MPGGAGWGHGVCSPNSAVRTQAAGIENAGSQARLVLTTGRLKGCSGPQLRHGEVRISRCAKRRRAGTVIPVQDPALRERADPLETRASRRTRHTRHGGAGEARFPPPRASVRPQLHGPRRRSREDASTGHPSAYRAKAVCWSRGKRSHIDEYQGRVAVRDAALCPGCLVPAAIVPRHSRWWLAGQ